MPESDAIHAAFCLARRSRFVYVTTNSPNGYPNTRVMFNLLKTRARAVATGPATLPDGFDAWLGTNTSSVKTQEARRDPRACLYFASATHWEGLTLTGTLEEILNREIKAALWMKAWDMYYAGGLDGGDFSVFRFHAENGRYYHGLRVAGFDASQPLAALPADQAMAS